MLRSPWFCRQVITVFAMKIIIDKGGTYPLPLLLAKRYGETKETFIHALLVLEDAIWVATNKGVGRWTRSTGDYVRYTTAHGLASNEVSGVGRRDDGALWVSTYDNGLCALSRNGHWTYFTENDPFDSKRIQALCHTADDSLWMSTPESVYQLDPQGAWRRHEFAGVVNIYQSRDGVLWFGLFENGVMRLARDGALTHFNQADRLGDGITVYAIYQTDDDALWFGGYESGVRRLDTDGHWAPVLEGDIDWYGVTSIGQEADGTMWFGRFDRLLCLDNDGTWRQINLVDEQGKASALPSVKIQRVDDALWVGLWGEAILQITQDDEVICYLTNDQL